MATPGRESMLPHCKLTPNGPFRLRQISENYTGARRKLACGGIPWAKSLNPKRPGTEGIEMGLIIQSIQK